VETAPAVFCGCLVVAIGAAIYFWLKYRNVPPPRRKMDPVQVRNFGPNPRNVMAELRQNLRIKAGWDEARVDRLIQLERERMPNAPLRQLMESAIERWERDNR
jgi:hypothetical protein